MNSDTTPGLYDFPAREYSIQGRWPSPDPVGLAAADPSNPQSWNRYAYVLNNPLAYTDPLGFGPQCHQDIPLACPTAFGGGGPDSNLPGDIFSSWNEFEVLGFAYTPGGTVTVLTEQNGEPVFVQVPTYPNIGALSLLPQFPLSGGNSSGGFFSQIKSAVCSALPSGRATSLSVAAGGIGSVSGSVDMVMNYNSGQTSLFATGGGGLGWNGGGSLTATTGFVYGLDGTNHGFSGQFKGGNFYAPTPIPGVGAGGSVTQ